MFLPSDVVSTTEKPRFFMALMNASLQRRVCSCSLKPLALAPGALGECPPLLVKVVKVVVKHSHSFPRWFFMSRRSSSIVPIRSSILVRVALMSSSLPDTSFNASRAIVDDAGIVSNGLDGFALFGAFAQVCT